MKIKKWTWEELDAYNRTKMEMMAKYNELFDWLTWYCEDHPEKDFKEVKCMELYKYIEEKTAETAKEYCKTKYGLPF